MKKKRTKRDKEIDPIIMAYARDYVHRMVKKWLKEGSIERVGTSSSGEPLYRTIRSS